MAYSSDHLPISWIGQVVKDVVHGDSEAHDEENIGESGKWNQPLKIPYLAYYN